MWRTLIILFYFPVLLSERGHTLPMARFYATFTSLSILFAGCYDLAKFWIWPFRTFKIYILITKSQQKYSNFVYFGTCLRISVSIRTSAKCIYIIYGYVTQSWYTRFQNQSHLFIRYAEFFHFMLFLLSTSVFYGVQKLKGKRVFGIHWD